jgi:ABC-type proline/glycine betaine transport system permease subunit
MADAASGIRTAAVKRAANRKIRMVGPDGSGRKITSGLVIHATTKIASTVIMVALVLVHAAVRLFQEFLDRDRFHRIVVRETEA